MSQPPATALRQVTPDAATTSAGQALEEPVQFSAMSQPPATALRHTVLLGWNASVGHVPEEPVQTS
jgi:hypothetical protein